MPKRMPYRATTASGNQFDFDFPLHPETGSAVHVANLLDAVLATLDREIRQLGPMSNGDVLQAVAMALAVRTRMLPGSPEQLAGLSGHLVAEALNAPTTPGTGNISPDEPRDVH
ncbi:MAG: hypothetical protein PVI87_05785 [Gammaproteobacteria bacterium]